MEETSNSNMQEQHRYAGHSTLGISDTRCPDCGAPAKYIEYIVAEGYPDAHIEYTEYCSSCGYDYCSEDD